VFSDPDDTERMKIYKVKERIRRADLATENTAITQIINETQNTREKVIAKSILDPIINMSSLEEGRARIRALIDNDAPLPADQVVIE
jgi:hypothetical protein